MKNVLHICDYASCYKGNFISSLEALAVDLEKNGVEQIYLLPYRARKTLKSPNGEDWAEELTALGRKIYFQEGSFLKNLLLINKICRQHKIGNIVRHFSDIKADIIVRIFQSRKNNIHFFHGRYLPKNRKVYLIKKFLYQNMTLVGVSEAVAKDLRKYFPKNRVVAIDNAIHFDRLNEYVELPKQKGITCMVMGYNWRIKGVDLAAKAVNELRKKYEISLNIVAASREQETKGAIEEIFGEFPDWITLSPSRVDVASYYKASDIFLSPSRSEGFCYALVEAAYCGCKVVASKIPAQGDLKIEDAYWFQSENVDDFVAALERAITDPVDTEKNKKRSEQLVELYDLGEWSEKVKQIFA